jgi:hypothetical protein
MDADEFMLHHEKREAASRTIAHHFQAMQRRKGTKRSRLSRALVRLCLSTLSGERHRVIDPRPTSQRNDKSWFRQGAIGDTIAALSTG